MGKPTGFMELARTERSYEAPSDRIKHYREFTLAPSDEKMAEQGSRCMDCGIPF